MVERRDELALLAHELGGALSPVRNAVDIVRGGTSGPLGADADRLLGIASRGLARADRVLRNIGTLTSPETYVPRREDVDAGVLLGRLGDDFAVLAASGGIDLVVESDPDLLLPTDPDCLEPVLENLLTNALKFTPRGGRVTLAAEMPRGAVLPGRLALLGGGFGPPPRLVTFEVRDTGVGLSPQTRRRLFEPFYRGPEAEGVPGLGLGLAVVRRMVTLLHAHLRCGGAPGGGTRFVLTLPADVPTLDLVARVDAALATLAPRCAAAPQALVVLRAPGGFGSAAAATCGPALVAALAEPSALVLELSPTTWVATAPVGVRALVQALVAALAAAGTRGSAAALRMHAQRTRRGASADECLLQGLVRCRYPLPLAHADREGVADAPDPAGR